MSASVEDPSSVAIGRWTIPPVCTTAARATVATAPRTGVSSTTWARISSAARAGVSPTTWPRVKATAGSGVSATTWPCIKAATGSGVSATTWTRIGPAAWPCVQPTARACIARAAGPGVSDAGLSPNGTKGDCKTKHDGDSSFHGSLQAQADTPCPSCWTLHGHVSDREPERRSTQ